MDLPNSLTFITLVVALCAYLAAIRLVGVQEIRRLNEDIADKKGNITTKSNDKEKIKTALRWLAIPDALFILSGLFLGLYVFLPYLFGITPKEELFTASVFLFAAGGIVLILYHTRQWLKSAFGK
jgi:hypothetical protein